MIFILQLELPRPDFVLNFGVTSSEPEDGHDEYDQTQLASSPHRKYSEINRGSPIGDVEGAESQWSTKLTVSSFQPSSLPNQVGVSIGKDRQEKSEESFDIITAGPDISNNDNNNNNSDIVVNASYLGNAKKTKKTADEVPVLQGRYFLEVKNDTNEEKDKESESQPWNFGNLFNPILPEFKNETKPAADISPVNLQTSDTDSKENNASIDAEESSGTSTTKRVSVT